MSIRQRTKQLLRRMGYDLSRIDRASHPLARRKMLLETNAVDVVLDVGANAGQFAMETRRDVGFSGRIISFEPLSSAFELLQNNAGGDPLWQVINCALGSAESSQEINVAGNSYSSSLLNMLSAHLRAAPDSRYVAKERIEVRSLDSMFDGLCSGDDSVYLKIDTQGYESEVIRGAEEALARIGTVQLEMSLVPLYEGQGTFADLHGLLSEKGFRLVSVEPGFSDPALGQMLQVDGIYHRS